MRTVRPQGASAIKLGYMAIASGVCDCVLVVGGEQMRVVSGWEATDFVATMLHPTGEYPYGLTLPSFAGMFTRLRFEKYGETSEDLARISVKNHDNATHNPCAHIQRKVKLERISDPRYVDATSPMVADPLRQFDMCPVSDGAAAVLLVAKDKQEELGFGHKTFARIAGIASATDTHYVADRADPTELLAVRTAAERAYQMAGMGPEDIDCAELHDAFLILELAESEECGLFPKGEAHLAVRRGETEIGGRIPINTSGGLKAKGHPLGATGVSQVVELVRQVRGEAEGRQVEGARTGLAGQLRRLRQQRRRHHRHNEVKEGTGMQEMYAYRCDKCGKLHHPRYAVCQNPECDGRSFTQEPLEGHCKLLTWTRVFNLPEGYMKAWLNFGIVQFDNGVTATGQLGFDERPEIGMDLISTVGVVKEGVGKDYYGFIFQKP